MRILFARGLWRSGGRLDGNATDCAGELGEGESIHEMGDGLICETSSLDIYLHRFLGFPQPLVVFYSESWIQRY